MCRTRCCLPPPFHRSHHRSLPCCSLDISSSPPTFLPAIFQLDGDPWRRWCLWILSLATGVYSAPNLHHRMWNNITDYIDTNRNNFDFQVTNGFLNEPLCSLSAQPKYHATFNEYLNSMRLPSTYLGPPKLIAAHNLYSIQQYHKCFICRRCLSPDREFWLGLYLLIVWPGREHYNTLIPSSWYFPLPVSLQSTPWASTLCHAPSPQLYLRRAAIFPTRWVAFSLVSSRGWRLRSFLRRAAVLAFVDTLSLSFSPLAS